MRDSASRPGASFSGSLTRGSLTRETLERLRRHLPLALVREQPRRLLEGKPPRLRHLVDVLGRNVAEPAGAVAEQKEADHLEDPLTGPGVDVTDIPQLLDGRRLHTCLLTHLPQSGHLGPLTGPDQPLW